MSKLDTTLDSYRVLFLTGSQHLYGPETLAQVADQSRAIAEELAAGVPSTTLPSRSHRIMFSGARSS